jgi:hypothetical protein
VDIGGEMKSGMIMSLPLVVVGFALSVVSVVGGGQGPIPPELEPLKELIAEKLTGPEDGTVEREIKSLLAQVSKS